MAAVVAVHNLVKRYLASNTLAVAGVSLEVSVHVHMWGKDNDFC